jgi:Uma2 family endonuclease
VNTQAKLAPPRMSAEEFIAWSMDQPSGRYELVDGEVVEMAAERVGHAMAKVAVLIALHAAVRARGLDCQVFGDGMAVQVADRAVYEPDAQVRYGPPLPRDAVLVPDPLIVVEVLSPSTRAVDTGKKLKGYFALPSVRHYLVLDPEDRTVIHHRREGAGIATRVLVAEEGGGPELLLDPPGLAVPCGALFEAP